MHGINVEYVIEIIGQDIQASACHALFARPQAV
jgi:hypothetical protein